MTIVYNLILPDRPKCWEANEESGCKQGTDDTANGNTDHQGLPTGSSVLNKSEEEELRCKYTDKVNSERYEVSQL